MQATWRVTSVGFSKGSRSMCDTPAEDASAQQLSSGMDASSLPEEMHILEYSNGDKYTYAVVLGSFVFMALTLAYASRRLPSNQSVLKKASIFSPLAIFETEVKSKQLLQQMIPQR